MLSLALSLQLVRYRCRKCRQLIATERNVIPQEGVGHRIFRRRQPPQPSQPPAAAATDGQGSIEQGAVFLEPISWMGDQVVGPVQGKLYCPNCSARLGSFNWSGESAVLPFTLAIMRWQRGCADVQGLARLVQVLLGAVQSCRIG